MIDTPTQGLQLFHGIPIQVIKCEEPRQLRFPRSKRRRIRKKWSRRADNWTKPKPIVSDGQVLQMGKVLCMNEKTLQSIKTRLGVGHK